MTSPITASSAFDTAVRGALDALSRSDLVAAAAHCAVLARLAPAECNSLFLRGVLAYRRDDAATAAVLLEMAARGARDNPQLRFWQGNAARALGDLARASSHYRAVLERDAGNADAAYNLALCLQDATPAQAAPWFVRAWRSRPDDILCCQAVVDLAARLARDGEEAPPSALLAPVTAAPLCSVIVCSITPSKLAALRRNLDERLAGQPWELIHIDDAHSLCEGYNRGLARARGEWIVLCHDDIEILSEDFHARLAAALDGADIVGVAGATKANGPAMTWAGLPHVHGWVAHVKKEGGYIPGVFSLAPPRIDGIQTLDGLFIAGWRDAIVSIGFDEHTFDGFHFYDQDFAYRAHLAGLRVRVQCDLVLRHGSIGVFDAHYWRYAERFCRKFPEVCTERETAAGSLCVAPALADHAQMLRFYEWIRHWLVPAH